MVATGTRRQGKGGAAGVAYRWWPASRDAALPVAVARWQMISFAVSGLAVVACLIASGAAGFPLDDSWIHQDFARTLATTGQFAFAPGRGGAGSTSPLWVLLLAPPQVLARGHAPVGALVVWSALLGWVCLAGLGVVTGVAARMLARRAGCGERQIMLAGLLAALATATEWHLVWAAMSGMETGLFALETMALLVGAARRWHPAWLGALTAATIATRPEGALIGGVVAANCLYQELRKGGVSVRRMGEPTVAREAINRTGEWLRRWAGPYAATLAAGLAPYLVLNLVATGRSLPSTFYAKAAFYGTGSAIGIVAGYAEQVALVLLASSPVLLALAALSYSQRLLTGAWRKGTASENGGRARMREPGAAAPSDGLRVLLWAWPVLLLAAYAVHLPEAYQHARYEMPALPPLIALASAGAAPLLLDGRRRLLATVGGALLVALAIVSLVRAAQIEATNVRYIDTFQVRTALWLREHTPQGALVATHDVGAIGYFSQRPIVDMAGLVDPQVVPLLDDQHALERYLASHHVRYVVMFVDWFPPPTVLVNDLAGRAVFTARSAEFSGTPDSVFVVYQTAW